MIKSVFKNQQNAKNIKLINSFLFLADVGFFGVFLYQFMRDSGLSYSQIMFAEALCSIFQVLLSIPIGTIIDMIGYKKTYLIGSIFSVSGLLILGIFPNFYGVVIFYLLRASTFGLRSGIGMFIYDIGKEENKPDLIIDYMRIVGIQLVLVNMTLNYTFGHLYPVSKYIPLVFYIVINVIGILIFLKVKDNDKFQGAKFEFNKLKDETIKSVQKFSLGIHYFWGHKKLKLMVLYNLVFWFLFNIAICPQQQFYKEELKLSSVFIGTLVMLLYIPQILGNLFSKKVINYFKTGTMPFILGSLLFGLFIVVTFKNIYSIFGLIPFSFMIGVHFAVYGRYFNEWSHNSIRGTVGGIITVLTNLIIIPTVFLIGRLQDSIKPTVIYQYGSLFGILLFIFFIIVFVNLIHKKSQGTRNSRRLKLITPTGDLETEYMNFLNELKENNENLAFYNQEMGDFKDFVQKLKNHSKGMYLSDGLKQYSVFWLIDEECNILGTTSIWHTLDNSLEKNVGHIRYGIRPSMRNKGYATQILKLALEESRKIGMKKIFLVCKKENAPSRRVILKNNGELESEYKVDNHEVQRFTINIR